MDRQAMTTALLIIDLQQAILTGVAHADRQSAIDARLDAVAARLGQVKHAAEASAAPVEGTGRDRSLAAGNGFRCNHND